MNGTRRYTMKSKGLRKCLYKCRTASASVLKHSIWGHFRDWNIWSCLQQDDDEEHIPKDVPRGYVVVYVGEECRRFVIKISLLDHPLFKALLDRAEEVFDFSSGSKLCIPCNESSFVIILQYVAAAAASRQDQRPQLCF